MVPTIGYTKTYILSLSFIFLASLWIPNESAHLQPIIHETVEDRLLFNTNVMDLARQFDSTEEIIQSKASIVEQQHKVMFEQAEEIKQVAHEATQ